jgi:hypothetical protein
MFDSKELRRLFGSNKQEERGNGDNFRMNTFVKYY